ncbi:MAG: glycoside hydrolase family 13 protein [Candidatus Sumerlaeaceae bacterium]|nr:glycoside hydrolase family 13 protein [Candidatus Sumerlaeaceae bacterium]
MLASCNTHIPLIRPILTAVLLLAAAMSCGESPRAATAASVYEQREADWRQGAVVYQVIVDRFAPPADLEAKRALYPPPKRLRPWTEPPQRGQYLENERVWSHELDFWGGDLQSLISRLDYLTSDLGIDVLYLNPIHLAFTNHKYDAIDYFEVSPEYGSRADVQRLAEELHRHGRRLVLDGVFNHMGRRSVWFHEAMATPDSPRRDWFFIGPQYKLGYRAWYNAGNLPELRLENPAVRARLFGDPDSVIQGYLRDGVDGWRLDVAFDIGYEYLADLTRAAHQAKPGSLVIGEVWNYPEQWLTSLDGVMNMVAREMIIRLAKGDISAPQAGRQLERMVADCGLEPLLKSWIILDNHDTIRLRTALPDIRQQKLAQALQFTLPGSPCVYYGVEVGMEGGDDPEQRAPMRWDLVTADNPYLQWTKRLLAMRRENRALRIGDFRLLDTDRLLAFLRKTDRAGDTIIVVANTSSTTQSEVLVLRDSSLMSGTPLDDLLGAGEVRSFSGTLSVTMPPVTAAVFRPRIDPGPEYTPYKRVGAIK